MNLTTGKIIIEQLRAGGVETFCLAPGSRSTPLTIAAAKYKPFVHFDERALGFFALGAAKATKKPVCVIVTSGTAVGNLMPAVMEADSSGVPLILLTSDRPFELRNTQANQTGDQVKIFGNYVRKYIELPSPSGDISARFLASTIAEAVNLSLFPTQGPVQINCPFTEPLLDEEMEWDVRAVSITHPQWGFDEGETFAEKLNAIEKGVIVLGGGADCPGAEALSKKLGWPTFADITSGYRETGRECVRYYHHLVKTNPDLKVDGILHLGGTVVSKVLMHWMDQNAYVLHVSKDPRRCDPLHCVTERVIAEPEDFCQKVLSHLEQKTTKYVEELAEFDLNVVFTKLSEPAIAHFLSMQNTALFLGNSMPIRDADMFLFPKGKTGPIFASRGLSGIDGNIATSAGIAEKHPLIAVMGDQTFLHDIGSLAMLKKTKNPVKLIVINNGGGGIFSFLPIGKKKEILDPYFAAAHTMTFEHSAKQFGLEYTRAETLEGLSESLSGNQSCIIEVITNREENLALHKQIDEICSSFCTVS